LSGPRSGRSSKRQPFLQLAAAINPRLRALVVLSGFGGLRTGELLALTRRDVDLVHKTVQVGASTAEINGSGRVLGPPKSEAGVRVIALPSLAVKVLDDHLSRYVAPVRDAVVFTGAKGGPISRRELSSAWREAVAMVTSAPTGLHIHDLRHAAATMMACMPGVNTKELMARIGHASPRAALIYQHATTERDRLIADYLDAHIAAAEAAADEVRGAPHETASIGPGKQLTRQWPRHPRAIERPRPGAWRQ
jgi:integrase